MPEPPPTPLFAPFPPTTLEPTYAWRAYTGPNINQSIVSTLALPRPLSDIPATLVAMVWYHRLPNAGDRNTYKTFDYDEIRPHTFWMPDGTSRINNTTMSAQAYLTLVSNLWANDVYPT